MNELGCVLQPLIMVSDAQRLATRHLKRKAVEDADMVGGWLLEDVVGIPRLELSMAGARALTPIEAEQLASHLERVGSGEPLQYVMGWTCFYGCRIRTDARALIPRHETEVLVDYILRVTENDKARIADVGTGTGCIAIALAYNRPRFKIFASDISVEAISLAEENIVAHGFSDRIDCACADLLALVEIESLDGIVSNPPYVTNTEWNGLARGIWEYEPRMALLGGNDGFAVIDRLLPQARNRLRDGGWLALEVGDRQADAVSLRMQQQGFQRVQIHLDLQKQPRIVVGWKPGPKRSSTPQSPSPSTSGNLFDKESS